MNEFTYLADVYRRTDSVLDLLQLGLRLAATPCSPLYRRNVSRTESFQAVLRSA